MTSVELDGEEKVIQMPAESYSTRSLVDMSLSTTAEGPTQEMKLTRANLLYFKDHQDHQQQTVQLNHRLPSRLTIQAARMQDLVVVALHPMLVEAAEISQDV